MSVEASWRPGSALTFATSIGAISVASTTPAGFTSGGGTVRIINSGTTNVQIVFGVGAQVATLPIAGTPAAGTMVRGGAPATYIDIPANADSFAAIGDAAGPSILYIQRGEGTGP